MTASHCLYHAPTKQKLIAIETHSSQMDGSEVQCGWCKDKYGVSRQITPVGMEKLLFSPDREKADRAMQAMLQMKKLDIAQMQKAYDGLA
jgi:predicted 3-demethylubiquinone-9 3-methyltransferase (glyoxalase superfamily)